jgi:hypothetical protein
LLLGEFCDDLTSSHLVCGVCWKTRSNAKRDISTHYTFAAANGFSIVFLQHSYKLQHQKGLGENSSQNLLRAFQLASWTNHSILALTRKARDYP